MDNSTPDMSEKLVQYLDGELVGNEKQEFELGLKTDPALQQQYDNLLLTREAIRQYGLQQQLAEIHGKMMQELQPRVKKISSIKRTLKYSIAAAASILLLVSLYLAYNFYTLSADKIFASNYTSYELSTLRDNGRPETTVEKAFKAKNYTEVIRLHDAGENRTQMSEFLCGIAALELKNNSKAISCFNQVIEANKQLSPKVLNDEAEYYLSLTYLQNKDYDYALELLRKIKGDSNHTYHEKVTNKILRQIRMLKWR